MAAAVGTFVAVAFALPSATACKLAFAAASWFGVAVPLDLARISVFLLLVLVVAEH